MKFWWMFILFAKTASASDNVLPSAEVQKGDYLITISRSYHYFNLNYLMVVYKNVLVPIYLLLFWNGYVITIHYLKLNFLIRIVTFKFTAFCRFITNPIRKLPTF